MTDYIYCRRTEGNHCSINFYVKVKGKEIYMFTQHFTSSVYEKYRKPVQVSEALKYGKGGRAMANLKEKLPKYLKYIEKEEEVKILQKTKNRSKENKAA